MLDPGAKQKCFYLAPNAEMLYLLSATSTNKTIIKNLKSNSDIEIVNLDQEQWIEIEWNGCQNIYDDEGTTRMNYVRLIKIMKLTSSEDSNSLISAHFGWMLGNQLRFGNYKRNGMKVKLLSKEDVQYDFSELFHDNETYEDILKKDKEADLC